MCEMPQDKTNSTTQLESSASSVSEQISEVNDFDGQDENIPINTSNCNRTSVAAMTMTDIPYNNVDEAYRITTPFQRDIQEYFK